MREVFPGYFAPAPDEFTQLWSESLFAFDANVLLRLYRSTPETREIFFGVLEKIAARIFLPNQAAHEYLRNRLGTISVRSDSYGEIEAESAKLAAMIERIIREQGLPNGDKIQAIANDAAKSIKAIVEESTKAEPDLLRSDSILKRIGSLFKDKTGKAYEPSRLKEIYEVCSRRSLSKVPPGYKDDKKPEPDKYGDTVIWFQLIDEAKSKKKPIIFITGDTKEDWWLIHKGETLGPRPELRQEMMTEASVDFYMYTTPKFLEFATQYLKLAVNTKQAESELEKIEKQEKTFGDTSFAYDFQIPTSGDPWTTWIQSSYSPSSPPANQWWLNESTINAPSTVSVRTSARDSDSSTKYFQLLPMNGYIFNSDTGKWRCEIVNFPYRDDDVLVYSFKFEPQDRVKKSRNLTLVLSGRALNSDFDWNYKSAIGAAITKWLGGNEESGNLVLL